MCDSPETEAPIVTNELAAILEDYRQRKRPLPGYDELQRIASSSQQVREKALEAAALECDRLTMALDHGGNEYRREASASQCAEAIRALKSTSSAPEPAQAREADGYAYRYTWPFGGTVVRFNNGGQVNGSSPIESIPYWLGSPPPAQNKKIFARPPTEKELEDLANFRVNMNAAIMAEVLPALRKREEAGRAINDVPLSAAPSTQGEAK